jgi:hypothetical protein
MRMKQYKISVRTLNDVILTFTVPEYKQEGGFVSFVDLRTDRHLKFAISNCEILEVEK